MAKPPEPLPSQWNRYLLQPGRAVRIALIVLLVSAVADAFAHPEDLPKLAGVAMIVCAIKFAYHWFFPKKKGSH